MPARNGRAYLDGLRAQEREVWLDGERVRDVTAHPALRHGAAAIAAPTCAGDAPAISVMISSVPGFTTAKVSPVPSTASPPMNRCSSAHRGRRDSPAHE